MESEREKEKSKSSCDVEVGVTREKGKVLSTKTMKKESTTESISQGRQNDIFLS
jgi:hypothetical protein